jgi:hypothetical protein
MKRLLVLAFPLFVAVLATSGCARSRACTFPEGDGTDRITADCLFDRFPLLGVDGDALLAVGGPDVARPNGAYAIQRLDTRRGTLTIVAQDVFDAFGSSKPIVANGEVYYLACDSTITNCSIQAIRSAGGAERTVVNLTSDQLPIRGFVVDSSSVYWINSGVWSAPLAGGTATRLADAHSSGVGIYDEKLLSVDDTGLYAEYSTTCPNVLEKIALDGSSRTMVANDALGAVFARDGIVYWMEPRSIPDNFECFQSGGGGSGGGCGGAGEYGSLRSWSADTGVQIVQDHIDGFGVIVGAPSIAWTVEDVCQAPTVNAIVQLIDGAPTNIATSGNEGPFFTVVTDGTNLYANDWTSIWRVPLRSR